jgi:hypothetical protein
MVFPLIAYPNTSPDWKKCRSNLSIVFMFNVVLIHSSFTHLFANVRDPFIGKICFNSNSICVTVFDNNECNVFTCVSVKLILHNLIVIIHLGILIGLDLLMVDQLCDCCIVYSSRCQRNWIWNCKLTLYIVICWPSLSVMHEVLFSCVIWHVNNGFKLD